MMRRVGVTTMLIGALACSRGSAPPAKVAGPAAPPPSQPPQSGLVCSDKKHGPSGLAEKQVSDGGYRRLTNETARDTIRGSTRTRPRSKDDWERSRRAMSAAIADLGDELRRCMSDADPVVPSLQYIVTLNSRAYGDSTLLEDVRVRRVADVDSNGRPVEAATKAEACIAEILTMIELPAGGGASQINFFMRYDGCVPAYDVGRAIAQDYARAYPAWAAAHPGETCPSQLDDLQPFRASTETKDPWGHPFKMLCGSSQRGDRALEVSSPGEDGKDGTDDDITSWK